MSCRRQYVSDTTTSADAPAYLSTRLVFADNAILAQVLGNHDQHLRLVESSFGLRLVSRGNEVTLFGSDDERAPAERVLNDLYAVAARGNHVSAREVRYAIRLAREGREATLESILSDIIQVTSRGRQIRPKSLGQKVYVDSIRANGIVFGIGPAGTGKTYLAMALAIAALKNRDVNRIVLTRPAVAAGERLGFLPGDMQEKVNPYLRPLYDALHDILGLDMTQRFMEKGTIEVAPLAFMRGRTLDDAFIILDEAQNTTPEQMKMFLTRLGFNSRAVITGDITQVDLPRGRVSSGLEEVQRVLDGVEGIEFVHLTEADVVRHVLVQRVIQAYDEYEKRSPRASRD
jgi:phosphate starvation-inducible protein PhoH and related proteins